MLITNPSNCIGACVLCLDCVGDRRWYGGPGFEDYVESSHDDTLGITTVANLNRLMESLSTSSPLRMAVSQPGTGPLPWSRDQAFCHPVWSMSDFDGQCPSCLAYRDPMTVEATVAASNADIAYAVSAMARRRDRPDIGPGWRLHCSPMQGEMDAETVCPICAENRDWP